MNAELNSLLKQTSRSFYLTLRVLPAAVRPQIGLAYLLARTTDTIADTELISLAQRLDALQKLRERILGQTSAPLNFGELAKHQGSPAEKTLLEKTEAGLANNIAVGIGYLESWLRGIGCVPLFNLMEDAATAEISRAQVWQWLRHGAVLDDGRPVTRGLVRTILQRELDGWRQRVGAERYRLGCFGDAAGLFLELVEAENFVEFLTLPAYDKLIASGA